MARFPWKGQPSSLAESGLHDDVGDNHDGDDDDSSGDDDGDDVGNGSDKEGKGQPRSLAEKCLHDFSLDQNLRCQFGSSEPITD